MKRRSRKGAWIEIPLSGFMKWKNISRSRKGAWIEMTIITYTPPKVTCRSRKGAWIEMSTITRHGAPESSLPQGSVD